MIERQKILIIDDNPIFRLLTKNILETHGFHVFEAGDGKEGLSLVSQERPAIVITDVLMPIMDGYEFLRHVRSNPLSSDIKVIFYTGTFSGMDEIALAKDGGAINVLIKPAEPEELLKAIRLALSVKLDSNHEIGPSYEREHLRILTNQLAKKVAELENSNESLRQEIKKRIQAENEALQSKGYFKVLLDSIPQLAWKMEVDGSVEYVNLRFREFYDFARQSVDISDITNKIHGDDRVRVTKIVEKSLVDRCSFHCEARLKRVSDGAYIYHLISAIFIPDSISKKASWFTTCTDISDQKKSEQKLIALKEQSESLSRAKTEFLSNISHELRTPLSAILGFSEILLLECDDQRSQLLERIRENAQKLTAILTDIISISEYEVTDKSVLADSMYMDQFLTKLSNQFSPRAKAKGLDFSISPDRNYMLPLCTYTSAAERVLSHLLDNAIKFTSSGYVRIRAVVTESGSDEKKYVVFEVEDTGTGIDLEKRDFLYQAFGQFDGSLTRMQGGLGLGLLISKKLAQSIGGQVEIVRSSLGKGSCFKFLMPIV